MVHPRHAVVGHLRAPVDVHAGDPPDPTRVHQVRSMVGHMDVDGHRPPPSSSAQCGSQIEATFPFAELGAHLVDRTLPAEVLVQPPPRAVEQRATQAARRALALDPTLAEAYTALGMTHMYACRWREADEAFTRAVAVDPSFAPGGYIYGIYLLRVGRIAEAEEPMRRARNADPLSGTASQMLAYVLSWQLWIALTGRC